MVVRSAYLTDCTNPTACSGSGETGSGAGPAAPIRQGASITASRGSCGSRSPLRRLTIRSVVSSKAIAFITASATRS